MVNIMHSYGVFHHDSAGRNILVQYLRGDLRLRFKYADLATRDTEQKVLEMSRDYDIEEQSD